MFSKSVCVIDSEAMITFEDSSEGKSLKLYDKKFELLIDLNITIIEFIKKEFNIKTKIYFSSELDISNSPDKILDICKQLNADKYISGTVWAKENLAVEK